MKKTILFALAFLLSTAGFAQNVIRFDFATAAIDDKAPVGWEYRGKPGTPDAVFSIVKDNEAGKKVLKMTADKASGVIMHRLEKVDLNKYPVMRWKWKAEILPKRADARITELDDQGISIYIGHGRFKQTSVSYAWQTETPKDRKGESVYHGLVTTYWFCIRNKTDGLGKWYVDERNVRKDILKTFETDEIPDDLVLTISTNSQYTESKAVCYLEYIEFVKEKK